MAQQFEIPKFLSHLRVDERGYPIPFFVPIKDGKPEFKYMCPNKRDLSIEKKLCHICGKKLNKDYVYFISGPKGLENKVCSDPAMHRECAEFSLAVCPHMLYEKATVKTDGHIPGIHATVKPEHLFLIKVAKWKAVFEPRAGYRLIHFVPVGSEEYIYINNKLVKA